MLIGLIAPPWVPVPPPRYGGTEEVIDGLARGLTALGHTVRLATVGESTCPVDRVWRQEHPAAPMGSALEEAAHVLWARRELADVDLIHDHTIIGALLGGGAQPGPPVVLTHHGVFEDASSLLFGEAAKTATVLAISHSQRASAPQVAVTAVIHHGIDLDKHPAGPGDGGYLLFLGRMSPDKGLHRAVRAARAAGVPLRVVSKMWDQEERTYFETRVRPLLHDGVELLGDVSVAERTELLRHATALLNPISWREPFGLVMIEALACGTPVIAAPFGAAVEIVDHGTTGFLCTDDAALVRAIDQVGELDRSACRKAAEDRFDMKRMAALHERLYQRVLRGSLPAQRAEASLVG